MLSVIVTVFQVLGALAGVGLFLVALQAIMVPDAEAKRLQIRRFWKTTRGAALYVLLGADAIVSLYGFLRVCLFAWPLTPGRVLHAAIDWSLFLFTVALLLFLPLLELLRVMLDQVKELAKVAHDAISSTRVLNEAVGWHTRLFQSLAGPLPQPEAAAQLTPVASDAEPGAAPKRTS